MLQHKGQAVEIALGQQVPGTAELDRLRLHAAEGKHHGPGVVESAGRQRRVERGVAKAKKGPDERRHGETVHEEGKYDHAQLARQGRKGPAAQLQRFAPAEAHHDHQQGHRQQQHRGVLRHARQAEDCGAEQPDPGPAVVQVTPVDGHGQQQEESHAHVRRGEAAVRQHGRAQRTKNGRDECAGRAPQPAGPEKHQQRGGGAEQRIHRARAEQHLLMVIAALIEEVVADEPHVGLGPGLVGQGGEVRAGEGRGQRLPALRQDAVLRLQPVVIPMVEGVATGDVREFVRGGRLLPHGRGGEPGVAHGQQDGDTRQGQGGKSWARLGRWR